MIDGHLMGLGLVALAASGGLIGVIGLVAAVFVSDRKCPVCRTKFRYADDMYEHFEWSHPEWFGDTA